MNFRKKFFLLSLLLTAVSCGGGGLDNDDDADVNDVRVDPSSARIGDFVTIQVEFEPAGEFDVLGGRRAKDTELVVLLPQGIDFVPESSEVDGEVFNDFRDRSPDVVSICPGGTRAVLYSFDSSELLKTSNDIRVRFKGRVTDGQGIVNFTAEADRNVEVPCQASSSESDDLIID